MKSSSSISSLRYDLGYRLVVGKTNHRRKRRSFICWSDFNRPGNAIDLDSAGIAVRLDGFDTRNGARRKESNHRGPVVGRRVAEVDRHHGTSLTLALLREAPFNETSVTTDSIPPNQQHNLCIDQENLTAHDSFEPGWQGSFMRSVDLGLEIRGLSLRQSDPNRTNQRTQAPKGRPESSPQWSQRRNRG